ncbi:DUF3969 family protein [Xenorhabdus sp. XENO-10]|uniref:DUF3969 family protein n=1 Tax=Xenorhabdus yunnanensis TaxID=3025878 RepID=A0ABT5LK80_9GAMM|nr:DUF3969 family protein [Xenorhabdus yunnanensis]MDC9591518.1 DUF3969 family protein [Xenorhabdus yunnanensis]
MKLYYSIEQKHAEKFVGLLILGVLYAVDKKLLSIDEAEGFIFQPHVIDSLKKLKTSDDLIEIIISGCELENIERLVPEHMPESINDLMQRTASVIRNSDEIGRLVEKEIKVKGKGRRG